MSQAHTLDCVGWRHASETRNRRMPPPAVRWIPNYAEIASPAVKLSNIEMAASGS